MANAVPRSTGRPPDVKYIGVQNAAVRLVPADPLHEQCFGGRSFVDHIGTGVEAPAGNPEELRQARLEEAQFLCRLLRSRALRVKANRAETWRLPVPVPTIESLHQTSVK